MHKTGAIRFGSSSDPSPAITLATSKRPPRVGPSETPLSERCGITRSDE
jgi:hypothetical protein